MKRRASVRGILAALLFVVAGSTGAYAQETRGSIEGVVKDNSGGVLPGVSVEAKGAGGGAVTAISDGEGAYRFPALAPGDYVVTATLGGFQTATVEKVLLAVGQVLKVNFALQIASLSTEVQVSAESPLIDVKQNAAAASIEKDIIDLIPKGRNFTSVVSTAPGTNNESRGGGIMIDGASGSENRFTVDGLDTTNLRNGTLSGQVLTDFVDQVQVKSSGYNAEYRATTGGVVSAITRSGTNKFNGELGAYYNNDAWLGHVRQALRLNPNNSTIAEYTTTPRDDNSYTVEPVMTLGGPILKDRIWFFAGYVPQYTNAERTVTFTQNRAAGPLTFSGQHNTDPKEDHNINYNVSGQVTRTFRTKFTGTNEPTKGGVSLPALEPDYISSTAYEQGDRVPDSAYRTSTANPTTFPSVLYTNTFTNSYRSVNDWVVTPKLYVNATMGYLGYGSRGQTLTEFNTGIRRTFSQSNVCNAGSAPGSSGCPYPEIPASLQQPSGYADSISNSRTVRDDYSRVAFTTDATYYGHFVGQHTLKGGFQYERLSNEILTGAQAPNIGLQWNSTRTTLDNPARLVRGTYGYYTIARAYTDGLIHTPNYGLFVQDAWTLSSRLTLNLGLRADQEDIPTYREENPGVHFSFAEKMAPRVGFAYDLKGDGKWKSYGSWGMFYDISKLELPLGAFGAQKSITYYYTLDTFNWPSISCDGPPGVGTPCPGTYIDQVDFRHVSNSAGSDRLIDPDLKPIRTQEFTLGLDHELARSISVGVRYSHKWLNRTIEDTGYATSVGEIFLIANPGEGLTENLLRDRLGCTNCPNQPLPERTYDGLEFRMIKRLSHNWYMNTSYLWSRLYGNYSGLASSDENGRTSPSVDRNFDGQYMSFDQTGQPVYGRLGTDRPHQFKFQGVYQLPWGMSVSGFYNLASGLPQSQTITVFNVPVFNLGRGNLGRTPVFSQTDFSLTQNVPLFGHTNAILELNVINLFDQDTVTAFSNTPYRDAIPVTTQQFFAGFNADAIAAATPSVRKDARFGLPSSFQSARSVRIDAKFRF